MYTYMIFTDVKSPPPPTQKGKEEVVRKVVVDWSHDRLYLLIAERAPGQQKEASRCSNSTTTVVFYLERCNLVAADCRRLDKVFKLEPEYLQVLLHYQMRWRWADSDICTVVG
jgi:hypothetical protein